jgi:hypothetical protein
LFKVNYGLVENELPLFQRSVQRINILTSTLVELYNQKKTTGGVNFLLEMKWTYSGRKFSVFSLYLSIFLTVIFRVSFRDFVKFKEWTSWWEIMNFLDAKNIGLLIEFLNIKLWTFFKCIQIELHSKKNIKTVLIYLSSECTALCSNTKLLDYLFQSVLLFHPRTISVHP